MLFLVLCSALHTQGKRTGAAAGTIGVPFFVKRNGAEGVKSYAKTVLREVVGLSGNFGCQQIRKKSNIFWKNPETMSFSVSVSFSVLVPTFIPLNQ